MFRVISQYLLFSVLVFTGWFQEPVQGTHLMGGSMTYQFQGMVGADQSYRVTLRIYRYCDASAGGTAPLDASMFLGIYEQDPFNPNDDKIWFRTENLPLVSSSFITPPSPGVDCSFNTTVCVEEGIFEADILLPPHAGGYHLMVERCCRNGNIANLSTPGSLGQTYYCFIPATPVLNSSPQFSDIPVPFICAGDTVTIVNNAFDPDGDSLVYSFEVPYSGYSSSINPVPDPQLDNNPYGMPVPPVLYNPGYSMPSPFGAGGFSFIDTQTGLTRYYIPNQGFFVVAIEIREYRNGVLIAAVRRDLQLISIACPVNAVPVLSNAGGAGQINFTITEGQTICFPVSFVDPNGDSLYLTSSGVIFNSGMTNPPASLPNASGDGFVTSQFCWSTDCGQSRPTPYQFVASVTDNGCPPKITNQIYSIQVNPSPLPPAPSVVIQQDPPGPICTGTSVTFTAIPTFGGTNPVYQWQLNGVNVGANSNTFTSSTLNNGDIITVSLVSNSVCVNIFTAVSPPVVMVVNPFAAPSVSIVPNPAGPICAGTGVTFTATPVNPGAAPVYQWTVNGVNSGSNSPVFTSSALTMGAQVAVTLTADASCPAANSNVVTMTVNPVLTPSVLITSDATGAICPGQLVTFRAFPTNGGTTPSYQWQINGANVGTNSNTFSSSTLSNGDNVSVILTSNENCTTSPTAVSNIITITVTAPTNPTVSITANPAGPVCKDDNIIFTATPVFGGTTPFYQWQVNGVNTGATGSVFSTSTLNNGDQVSVVMTSSLNCLNTATANSNIITVTVNPNVTVTASISISPATQFCAGTPVTFTAVVNNGGTAPQYQWQINGINSGPNSSTLSTSTLADGDRIRVMVTSNQACVSPVVATSNQILVDVLPLVAPSVSIVSNPPFPVCQGSPVTFTATPVAAGTTPGYEWYVNNLPVASGSATFSTTTLADGDFIQLKLVSSEVCPSPLNAYSNIINANIIPTAVPSVSFTASTAWPACEGTPVTFNAFPVNGGTAPVFTWQVNGTGVGNGSSLTLSTLNDGDSIRVRMISNELCANPPVVYSDTMVAEFIPYLTPLAVLYMNPPGSVCDGDSLFFQVSVVNAGTNPGYNWMVNGLSAGTNSNLFGGVFNDNDTITAYVSSSYQCLTKPGDTTNFVVTSVLPNLTPSVSIAVLPVGPVCPGDLLTFSATAANEGTTPAYQWYVNGLPAGSNNSVFSSTTLNDGDLVRVELTSSEVCVTGPTALSNIITVQVSPNIVPDITISVAPSGSVCDGDSLSFSVSYIGAGSSPQFEWRINGIPNGIITPDFTSTQLNNNDIIDVILVSSAFCALPVTDTSNSITAAIDPLLVPAAVISADPPGIFCDGAEITYAAVGTNGGTSPAYQWQVNGTPVGTNNDTLITDALLDGDILQVVYTSSERCLAFNPALSNQLIIERHPPLEPVITGPSEVCQGEEITLQVAATGGNGGPYFLQLNQGLGSGTEFTFTPAQTAVYILTADDSCSTTRYDSLEVVVHPLPEPSFTIQPPSSNMLYPYFNFVDGSGNTMYWLWQFGDGTYSTQQHPFHAYQDPDVYTITLTATSDKGCMDSTSRTLVVENIVTFYLPNAFTPNGDGDNDIFGVIGYSVSGYDLEIYNRWGQQVYHSQGSMNGWRGTGPDGSDAPTGVYTYRLRVLNDPGRQTLMGTVTLIR